MYGRENRLKVARDEAKHAEEQREKLEKQRLVSFTTFLLTSPPIHANRCTVRVHHNSTLLSHKLSLLQVQAESEVRRAVLLQQAAQKRRSTDPGPVSETAQLPEPEQEQAPALLQHINFFEEHEARDAHPEASSVHTEVSSIGAIERCFPLSHLLSGNTSLLTMVKSKASGALHGSTIFIYLGPGIGFSVLPQLIHAYAPTPGTLNMKPLKT